MKRSKMHPDIAEIIIDEDRIRARVAELARQISCDYEGKELFMVGILKGAAIFLADLVRRVTIPVSYDFVAIQSYGSSTKSSGVVRILKDLEQPVESKHVLVVEDIVDTGLTMRVSYLLDNLKSRKAASVKVCALLDRPGRRVFETEIDYTGFVVPDKFVVGYGLDYQERYRSLPYIGVLKPDVYGGG